MAIGSSLSGISFSGISSGIDTESIITRLLQIDQAPIQRMQVQQAQLTSKLGLMSSLRGKLGAFNTALSALSSLGAFKGVAGTSSDPTIADISITGTASAGKYDIEVLKLAQKHKVASEGQASTTTALGMAGTIVFNGRGIEIAAEDSLKTIAEKVNNAKVGVTASVIDGGSGNAFLSLTSHTSGVGGAVQLGDLSGQVLQDLGLLNGTTGFGPSFSLSSKTDSVAQSLGLTSAPSGMFTINGVDIFADLSTDSLEDIAAAINASGSGATAEVKSGTSGFRLEISGATSHADADGLLKAIGVVRAGFENEVLAAQDAEFTVDGITLKHGDNSVENVIPGATLALKKAGLTTIDLTQDLEGVEAKIDDFVARYNDLIDFVRSNTSLNAESFATGALFADPAVARIEDVISRALFTPLKGNDGTLQSLGDIGITFDSGGKLKVDKDRLGTMLESNIDGVAAIFRSTGTTSVKELGFVSGTSKTKPSGAIGYQVFITALAAKQRTEAAEAQAGPLAQQEVLTFTGAAFGGSSYELTLEAGLTQQQVVDRINADPKLKGVMTATVDGGKLRLESSAFGTAAAFSLTSNVAASGGGTGWGAGVELQAAADVAGTINGEAAIGAGQVLTGAAGNTNTDGLQVRYDGLTTGVVGTVTYSAGLSNLVGSAVVSVTDSVNGLLTQSDKAIQAQIDGLASTIAFRQEQLETKRLLLQTRFSRMEQMIAELQAQQARIASFGQ